MHLGAFDSWLSRLNAAYENRDSHEAANLFSEDATYQQSPFEQPLVGHSDILKFWSEVPITQEKVQFEYEILAVTEQSGIAHWWVSFISIPEKKHIKRDGVLMISLDFDGRCKHFREWWHEQTA